MAVADLAMSTRWVGSSPHSEAICYEGKGWMVLRALFPAPGTKKSLAIKRCCLMRSQIWLVLIPFFYFGIPIFLPSVSSLSLTTKNHI